MRRHLRRRLLLLSLGFGSLAVGFLQFPTARPASRPVAFPRREMAAVVASFTLPSKALAAAGPSAEDAALLGGAFAAMAADPRRPGAREELEAAEEAFTTVIQRFDEAGASRQDRGELRMARAQARIAINDCTGGQLPAKAEAAVQDYSDVVQLMEEDGAATGTFDYPSVFVRRALAREEIAYGRKDKKQWEAAVQDYTKAIDTWRSRPPSETGLGVNPLVLNYRGNAFGQLGRFKDALADYREATEIFIKDQEYTQAALSRCNEALALFGISEPIEAISIMEDVVRRDPSIADAHIALAASYWSEGDYSRAEDEWRVACQNTDVGCRQYKDLSWVENIRRWPPQLVGDLGRFLNRDAKGQKDKPA